MYTERQTLTQRLAASRLTVSEALQLALKLGNALRQLHDGGHAQGALTPDHIVLTDEGLELLPAELAGNHGITPYIAPELIHESAPDVRSDIFSFGAVVYEMLTGKRAFLGEGAQELAEAITHDIPEPVGNAGVDRLVRTSLAKDPANRWQKMQHVLTEIRLAATVRRADEVSTPSHRAIEKQLRAEIEELETRLADRLEQYEKTIFEMQRSITDELAAQQVTSLDGVSESLAVLQSRLSETDCQLDSALERAAHAEQAAEGAMTEIASLHVALSEELHSINDKVRTQSAGIETVRSGIARTDDLVERVVEALEVLQGMVFEQNDQRIAHAS